MSRAALAAVGAIGAIGSAVVAVADSPAAGLLTAAILFGVGVPALAAGRLLERRRTRIGSLRNQLGLAVALALGQLLVGAAAFAGLMFLSLHDALLLSLLTLFCGAVAVAATRPVARGVLADVDAVRDGLDAVAGGRRDIRIVTGGHDELADLATAADRMTARLAAEEGARRRLVAAVSHDLRTPITSLRLLADGLREDVIPPEEREATLLRMGVHLRALSGLIDDLFELSRLEAGDVSWALQQVRLSELVDEAIDAMRAEAAAKGIEVRSRVPDDLSPVSAEPERLQRVLFNLIQNAIRHTPADGSVTVLAEPGSEGLEVEVADTGPGIAAAEHEHVFEPFFQGGDRAARTDGGAGLGLAISRAIVEAHGGRIWLESAARGTRVRFSLRYG